MAKTRKIKRLSRDTRGFKAVKCVIFAFFALYALTLIFPFVWSLVHSLNDPLDFKRNQFAFPKELHFENYATAWSSLGTDGQGMMSMLWNSLWITFFSSAIQMITQICVAYAVARYRFWGRNVLYAIALVVLMIPIYGALPATYVLYDKLNMYDNPFILLSNICGLGGNFILLYSFFKTLPWSYAESGFIDGAGHFCVFFRIMLPLATAPVTALFIMTLVASWNDYLSPILYMPSYMTIPSGLYSYQLSQIRNLNYPVLFAGIIMSMLPILVLYIVAQDKMMSLTIAGGLKG